MKDKILYVKKALEHLAGEADNLENKHLRDIIRDASNRLHDAANHPDASPAPEAPQGAQTGEPNPMDPGPQPVGGVPSSPFPPAMTGEADPMKQ